MIDVVTRTSLFYHRREIWFYDGDSYLVAPNTVFYQASSIPAGPIEQVETFTTSTLDLTRPLDDLLGEVHSTTRAHIRKGRRLGVETETFEAAPPSLIDEFVEGHAEFWAARGLTGIETERVTRLVAAGHFTISRALFEGRVIATHGHVHDEHRARLLISYDSPNKEESSLRGYANKLLHWDDITHFQASGLTTYDFGGVDIEGAPGISRFKLSFGGSMETSTNCVIRTGLYGFAQRWRERNKPEPALMEGPSEQDPA